MRGLKIALILFGAIHILLGLVFAVAPHQAAGMMGFGEIGDFAVYIAALCGLVFVVAAVCLIVAGRDPLEHIIWVKFAILWSIVGVVGGLYSIVQGAASFSQVSPGIITGAVFAVAFLALYPYRLARSAE